MSGPGLETGLEPGLETGVLRPPGGGERIIRARGLTRRFGALTAVDDFSLDVYQGEVFGFLGPNGSGKSTLIRMLVGLLTPSAGTARVCGYELPAQAEQLRPQVGYMTQRFSLYDDLSVEENLEFAAEIFGLGRKTRRRRVEETLEEYGLGERRRQRPATLSGGWRQRLALAVATIHRPRLLVLDEPTAGVDPDRRRDFWARLFELAAEGVTVLVSTHYMDEAVRCHRLCMLLKGRRAALGSPTELADSLDDRVVEVRATPVEKAIALLRTRPEVKSATQLGSRVHLLLTPDGPSSEEASRRLVAFLEGSEVDVISARPAEPNLEDVFVALSLGEKLKGAAA